MKAAAQASGVKRIVRHNIANIRFVELTPLQAKSCYFTVFTEIGLDHYGRYRDTFVPVGERGCSSIGSSRPTGGPPTRRWRRRPRSTDREAS